MTSLLVLSSNTNSACHRVTLGHDENGTYSHTHTYTHNGYEIDEVGGQKVLTLWGHG